MIDDYIPSSGKMVVWRGDWDLIDLADPTKSLTITNEIATDIPGQPDSALTWRTDAVGIWVGKVLLTAIPALGSAGPHLTGKRIRARLKVGGLSVTAGGAFAASS